MDSRSEQPISAAEIDSAYSVASAPPPHQASEQPHQSQPSLLELNGIFLVLMTALAAIFTAAAILISTS
jgi:hypothetical protein